MSIRSLIVLAAAAALASPALAAPPDDTAQGLGVPVNVLEDCWTNHDTGNFELENYLFDPVNDPINFIWKQKLLLPCTNYVARIVGFECRSGKPKPQNPRFNFQQEFGPIDPDPAFPERLFVLTVPPGAVPPGFHDWILFVECDDTNGGIPFAPDGDIDDECGINVGRAPVFPPGPRIYGPEPVEIMDADPGGFPPGRAPGEEGATRPWCFQVD